ncbi:MAG TPA: hypothetical protein EYN66_01410 [Myxococcales bacterium]|nr:hypothetical protein [Myxococcales bacterium]
MKYTYIDVVSGGKAHGDNTLRREVFLRRNVMPNAIADLGRPRDLMEVPYVAKMVTKVVQSKDGEEVGVYDSVDEAAKALGKKNGKYLTKEIDGDGSAYGFDWAYKDIEE